MFDKERFIQQCMAAVVEGPSAIREIVAEAVFDRAGIVAEFGEPVHAAITPLYNGPDLTINHFVWAPYMNLMPHNHQMFSVVGIYWGREDNVFWRRTPTSIEAAGAESLGAGDVAVLDRDVDGVDHEHRGEADADDHREGDERRTHESESEGQDQEAGTAADDEAQQRPLGGHEGEGEGPDQLFGPDDREDLVEAGVIDWSHRR